MGLAIALLLSMTIAVSVGSVMVPLDQVWLIIFSHLLPGTITPTWTPAADQIVWVFRLPRVLLAVIVGAALAVSGTTLQAIARNPLADPFVFGVSYGATVG
ncbi:MAG: iron chelate uptake ABC transporter family permease subunit, partial [Cyanothece sp. SIO2G6]|nr:iron chelate uptake ABC transporter family permease subunit [Cyanothece sp. SIO2G6]